MVVCQSAESGLGREWALRVSLAGLSVSLVARAELVHSHGAGLCLELCQARALSQATLHVASMQWDNQVRTDN